MYKNSIHNYLGIVYQNLKAYVEYSKNESICPIADGFGVNHVSRCGASYEALLPVDNSFTPLLYWHWYNHNITLVLCRCIRCTVLSEKKRLAKRDILYSKDILRLSGVWKFSYKKAQNILVRLITNVHSPANIHMFRMDNQTRR